MPGGQRPRPELPRVAATPHPDLRVSNPHPTRVGKPSFTPSEQENGGTTSPAPRGTKERAHLAAGVKGGGDVPASGDGDGGRRGGQDMGIPEDRRMGIVASTHGHGGGWAELAVRAAAPRGRRAGGEKERHVRAARGGGHDHNTQAWVNPARGKKEMWGSTGRGGPRARLAGLAPFPSPALVPPHRPCTNMGTSAGVAKTPAAGVPGAAMAAPLLPASRGAATTPVTRASPSAVKRTVKCAPHAAPVTSRPR